MNELLLASFNEILSYALYILIAILVLLVMITVHELGHYIAGKILGFGIEEFSIGFGPKIYSKQKKNGEIFSVRLLPLGGFCAFKGEDKEDEDESAFNNKKPWQRIIVLVSGALMNYLTAVLVIALMFGIYGQSAIMTYKMQENVIGIEQTFEERDIIVKAEGKNVYLLTDLMEVLDGKKEGEEVDFSIIRDGKRQNVKIVMLKDTTFSSVEDVKTLCNALGIPMEINAETGEILSTGFRTTGVRLGFFATIGRTFEYSFKLAGTVFTVLGQLLTGALGLGSVGGTVTTISVTAGAIKTGGLWSLLNIMALIGVNLAVFNLLPVPALDGSRVVFTAIEWVRKKPINRRIEGIIHTVGLILIFLFAIIVDLNHCF